MIRKRLICIYSIMRSRPIIKINPYQVNEMKEDLFSTDEKDNKISIKSQRKTNNLGCNTAKIQDNSYSEIEEKTLTAKCTDSNHIGDRILPVRMFYLNKGGKGLQGACITCQKNRRANRIKRSREKFANKTKTDIYEIYTKTYGEEKCCSKCKLSKPPSEFPISISMETGLHNHCSMCMIGNSQGNGGLRDFIFLPDKDGIKYIKKDACERCGGNNKLAVDHILPIAKGGIDCVSNKQTLCMHCNSKKSDTIDCVVNPSLLCNRYKDELLDFTNNIILSQVLSKKVYEFRNKHIKEATMDELRNSLKEYIKENNLGHNLDRIINKITLIFSKS